MPRFAGNWEARLLPVLERVALTFDTAAPRWSEQCAAAVDRWKREAEALRFHLLQKTGGREAGAPMVVVLGGTGTGKSTLVNRLTAGNRTASSFRRTHTAGPVAVARRAGDVPDGWLAVEHQTASPADLPARGRVGALVVVETMAPDAAEVERAPSTSSASNAPPPPVLVDTPDLDGDQPIHHAQADRAFRWAEAVVIVVTPEKYQMTEALPYYRLARRYAVPLLCVMNKCEEAEVLDDYARQVGQWTDVPTAAAPYAAPRDDSAYAAPPGRDLSSLRAALGDLPLATEIERERGLRTRARDALGRLADQVLSPLREERREVDRKAAALRELVAPEVGVDVNPITQQLQRRLRQRSILYLMGPQRILDRVRQAPTLLARLPRAAWEYLRRGELSPDMLDPTAAGPQREAPDFAAMLVDQFAVLHSRIDEIVGARPHEAPPGSGGSDGADLAQGANPPDPTRGAAGSGGEAAAWFEARIDPLKAGQIAEEELADLKVWLERKWNATPRDTRLLEAILKRLPGGKKLSRWSEAAPYLLTVVLITHGAVFGHLDLLVLGGYSLVTWITERLSNEVSGRTRTANTRIERRFADLASEQVERVCAWLDRQAPDRKTLDQLDRLAEEMNDLIDAD